MRERLATWFAYAAIVVFTVLSMGCDQPEPTIDRFDDYTSFQTGWECVVTDDGSECWRLRGWHDEFGALDVAL